MRNWLRHYADYVAILICALVACDLVAFDGPHPITRMYLPPLIAITAVTALGHDPHRCEFCDDHYGASRAPLYVLSAAHSVNARFAGVVLTILIAVYVSAPNIAALGLLMILMLSLVIGRVHGAAMGVCPACSPTPVPLAVEKIMPVVPVESTVPDSSLPSPASDLDQPRRSPVPRSETPTIYLGGSRGGGTSW